MVSRRNFIVKKNIFCKFLRFFIGNVVWLFSGLIY